MIYPFKSIDTQWLEVLLQSKLELERILSISSKMLKLWSLKSCVYMVISLNFLSQYQKNFDIKIFYFNGLVIFSNLVQIGAGIVISCVVQSGTKYFGIKIWENCYFQWTELVKYRYLDIFKIRGALCKYLNFESMYHSYLNINNRNPIKIPKFFNCN